MFYEYNEYMRIVFGWKNGSVLRCGIAIRAFLCYNIQKYTDSRRWIMSAKVLFPTDIYKVSVCERGIQRDITVHTTLTGECTKRIPGIVPDEIFRTYNFPNQNCHGHTRKTYYTAYTFAEEACLDITLPSGTEQIKVKPESAEKHVKLSGGRVRVTTDETLYFVIYPDGDIFGGLRVLLDKEKPMPCPHKNKLIFTDGIYTAENCQYIRINENGAPVIDGIDDDTLIWIGKNAVVNAAIELRGVRNVTVAGTGIITTLNRAQGADESFSDDIYWGLFRTNALPNIVIRSGCDGIVIDGPILDCEFRGIVIRNSDNIEIRNVKFFAASHNADGINCYNTRSVLVEDCFIQSQDDAFCMYNACDSIPWLYDEGFENVSPICRDVEFHRNIIFTNCRPFVFGGHATGDTGQRCLIENIHVNECSIIETPVQLFRTTERFAYFWTSVIRILSQSEQIVRNLTFENMTVDISEGYGGKVFHLHVRSNEETSYTESQGFCIENVTFRNIEIRGATDGLYPSVIKCRVPSENEIPAPHIDGILFENVTLGGRPLSEEDFRIEDVEGSIEFI